MIKLTVLTMLIVTLLPNYPKIKKNVIGHVFYILYGPKWVGQKASAATSYGFEPHFRLYFYILYGLLGRA